MKRSLKQMEEDVIRFHKRWKKNDYQSPTYFDCYLKGFEDGLKLGLMVPRERKR